MTEIDIFREKATLYSHRSAKVNMSGNDKAVSEVVTDISEGVTVKESLGKVADSIKNVFSPESGDTAAGEVAKVEPFSEAVSEAAVVIKDSLKDTITDDKFLGGLALGLALGAVSHYIYTEHGEAIGDGVRSLGAGVAEGIGAGVSKIKGLFKPTKKNSKDASKDVKETKDAKDANSAKVNKDTKDSTTRKIKIEPKN